jgi:HPt (histidine-containing phosphotransfer) domain-containing protein
MDKLLKTGDMAQLSEVAHGMKSSAANLGASELSQLCFTLEQQGELPAPTTDVHRLVKEIKAAYVIAERALKLQIKLAA